MTLEIRLATCSILGWLGWSLAIIGGLAGFCVATGCAGDVGGPTDQAPESREFEPLHSTQEREPAEERDPAATRGFPSADPAGTRPASAAPPATAPSMRRPSAAGSELLRTSVSPLVDLPKGAEQQAKICGRGLDDRVVRALCSNKQIDSIAALQFALGLELLGSDASDIGFALLGHSTSLVSHEVSAINPRAFVFTSDLDELAGAVVMAFVRGAPFVELAAQDSMTSPLTFYLLEFELECERSQTCTNADLLTPAIETGWQGFSLYDDEDLKNTIVDCRHCHQPNGPGTPPTLLMLELERPWTHWLSENTDGGEALLQDFLAAHDGEDYAGIPANLLLEVDAGEMEDYVSDQGYEAQSNMFSSSQIEREVEESSSGQQPLVNVPKGRSPTWQQLFDNAAAARSIPPPYHDVKVTDQTKVAAATASYKDFMAGRIPAQQLLDIRDVFLDEALPDLMFAPAKGLTGREILVQACGQCHNARLDQSLSRAAFDVTGLDQMTAEVKQRAIERLTLPPDDILRMPPVRFRTLSREAIELAIEELLRK